MVKNHRPLLKFNVLLANRWVYNNGMLFVSILHHYFLWHYTNAFREILHIWLNFFWFTVNFFSLKQLTSSFFSPWKRITEQRGDKFNFEDFASFIIINLISRLLGILFRSIIIALGLIVLLLLCVGIIATYIFWVVAPLLIVGGLIYGIIFIFI